MLEQAEQPARTRRPIYRQRPCRPRIWIRWSPGLTEPPRTSLHYPHVRVHGPAGFGNAWKNLWPAYVKGAMDTATFLSRLATIRTSGGN